VPATKKPATTQNLYRKLHSAIAKYVLRRGLRIPGSPHGGMLSELEPEIGGWWARKDLNLGPMDYESTALTAELRALKGNVAI
jgi:hypothetical protein